MFTRQIRSRNYKHVIDSIKWCHLTSIKTLIVEIRRSQIRLISTTGHPILVRRLICIKSARCFWKFRGFIYTTTWHGPLILLNHRDIWIISSFFHSALCVACWSCCMSNHELQPVSVSHPFVFVSSSSGLAGGNTTRKLFSLSLTFIFKILIFHVTFLISYIPCYSIISPYFLLVDLLLFYMALFQSKELGF